VRWEELQGAAQGRPVVIAGTGWTLPQERPTPAEDVIAMKYAPLASAWSSPDYSVWGDDDELIPENVERYGRTIAAIDAHPGRPCILVQEANARPAHPGAVVYRYGRHLGDDPARDPFDLVPAGLVCRGLGTLGSALWLAVQLGASSIRLAGMPWTAKNGRVHFYDAPQTSDELRAVASTADLLHHFYSLWRRQIVPALQARRIGVAYTEPDWARALREGGQ
jgi:hypothetical protein